MVEVSPVALAAGSQHGERGTTVLAALAFFCILTAYFIIRPVRDQLVGAVGSEVLPLFYAATLAVMLLLTPLFGWLASRLSRRRLLVWSYSMVILIMLAFVPAFVHQQEIGARQLGMVFFVWASVFNLFVVSLFWSLMADLFDTATSHRIFPLIGVGGTLGALAGPIITTALVGIIGVAPLLVVSASLFAMALGILIWLSVRRRAGNRPAPPMGGSILAGIRQVFTQPFVRMMAILMLLSDGVGTFAYALLADYSNAHFVDRVVRTAFYSRLDLGTNLLVIALQIGFTRWALMRNGAGFCLVWAEALNVLLFVMLGVFTLSALPMPWFDWHTGAMVTVAVPVIALVVAGSRGLAYGVIVPAANTLYTRAAREARYKGKNFVDTTVWRFGDLVVTSSLVGLRGLGAGIPVLAALSSIAAALAGWVGWRAANSPDLAPTGTDTRRET